MMIPIQLEVEENEYDKFIVMLRSLRYVKLEQKQNASTVLPQIERIKAALEAMPQPIFAEIKDPLEWQRSIRDEWS
jgi:hypothetical protein